MKETYDRETVLRFARFAGLLSADFEADYVDLALSRHFDALAKGNDAAKLAEAVADQADPRWRRDSFSSRLTRPAGEGDPSVLAAAKKRFREERESKRNPLSGS